LRFHPAACMLKPSLLLSHGFANSSAEWAECQALLGPVAETVLLGAHTVTEHAAWADRFRRSTWQDWGQPVVDRYTALAQSHPVSLGLISTSASLILMALASGQLQPLPQHIVLVDPLIEARHRWRLRTVGLWGPLVRTVDWTAGKAPEEYVNTYKTVPYEALKQLHKLCQGCARIQTLPAVPMTVFVSRQDPVVNSDSTQRFFRRYPWVQVHVLDSQLHAMVRLKGRPNVTDQDYQNQSAIVAALRCCIPGATQS